MGSEEGEWFLELVIISSLAPFFIFVLELLLRGLNPFDEINESSWFLTIEKSTKRTIPEIIFGLIHLIICFIFIIYYIKDYYPAVIQNLILQGTPGVYWGGFKFNGYNPYGIVFFVSFIFIILSRIYYEIKSWINFITYKKE
jgi:hypothetical protein